MDSRERTFQASGFPLFGTELFAQPLKVRTRWWNRPVCWVRKHRYYGEPITDTGRFGNIGYVTICEQPCGRCGKTRSIVGCDPGGKPS